MTTIQLVLGILLGIISVALIAVVLLQPGKDKRLSGAIAGGADTFYGKNKGKSKQKKLSKLTAIASIVFVVVALATFVVGK